MFICQNNDSGFLPIKTQKKSHSIFHSRMALYLSIWSFTFIISFQDYFQIFPFSLLVISHLPIGPFLLSRDLCVSLFLMFIYYNIFRYLSIVFWKFICIILVFFLFCQNKRTFHIWKVLHKAGLQGFEPWNDGVRVRCLTVWR